MNTTEKVAYLKGLAEGLGIDNNSKEGKLFTAIIDALNDIALDLSDVTESVAELDELVDIIDEDLGDLEEDYYDLESDDDNDDEYDNELYELTCPTCNDVIYLDEATICMNNVVCPNCSNKFEIDIVEDCGCGDDCDCDDDCGCGCSSEKTDTVSQ